MPIILAIEPDRRQRDALTAVVRKRVGAELIIADTTERALEGIGNRVPDLVLIPALLSPQDDAALAAALRVIAAAAHVRTLTIPVLAAHTEAARPSGLLSRWRRGRSSSDAPDGCDPGVFAEQILAYLKESAAERALMVDDLEDDVPVNVPVIEPEYAQEFGLEDAQPGANTYVQADAQAYVRADAQAYQTDTHDYDQTVVQPYAQPDEPAYAQSDVPAYTQSDVPAYAQTDVPYAQPDVRAYVQTDVQTYSPPDVQAYAQPDVQPSMQADVQDEVLDLVEGDEIDTERAGSDGLSTLRLNQEEDIDLSDELSEIETEAFDGTRRDTSDTELFDGEPVGVYTMPSEIDEPDIDVAVLAARKAFAEVEAAIEPAFDEGAFAESEFEAEAAVDSGFFAESFAEPLYAAEPRTESEFEAEAVVARAFEAETVAGTPAVEDIDSQEIAAWSADAEPWDSASLSPRWVWPAMEGVPTESPTSGPMPAEAAVASAQPRPARTPAFTAPRPAPPPAVAEARPAPAAHKRPEWSELVASLRKDIERRRIEPPQEKPKPTAQAPAPRRSKQPKPVQDEWGFFDPEQCGFAALLAKLDEITEGEETEVRQSK